MVVVVVVVLVVVGVVVAVVLAVAGAVVEVYFLLTKNIRINMYCNLI